MQEPCSSIDAARFDDLACWDIHPDLPNVMLLTHGSCRVYYAHLYQRFVRAGPCRPHPKPLKCRPSPATADLITMLDGRGDGVVHGQEGLHFRDFGGADTPLFDYTFALGVLRQCWQNVEALLAQQKETCPHAIHACCLFRCPFLSHMWYIPHLLQCAVMQVYRHLCYGVLRAL